MRFLEAICNGCVVVSEPCLDNEPLVPGEHFLVAGTESIAGVVNACSTTPSGCGDCASRPTISCAASCP